MTAPRPSASLLLGATEHPLGSDFPISYETIYVRRSPSGRNTSIGQLIHRPYPSGYPHPYEVARHGGTTWGFYETREAAEIAAGEYADAFRDTVAKAGPEAVISFAAILPTDQLPVHQDIDRATRDLVHGERVAAAQTLRAILDRARSEGSLRHQLERYADKLAGAPR